MSAQNPLKSPMLAASTTGSGLRFPMLASPKLDGIRALVIGGRVLSRKFKEIPNRHVQEVFGRQEFNGLDGELIVGDPSDAECYRRTMSGVMSADGAPEFAFHVFDDFTQVSHSFESRLRSAVDRTLRHALARQVPHVKVLTEEQLVLFEEQCLARGFEGVMLRHVSGRYKEGRSTLNEGLLLKLKRFEDGEAEVVGYTELMHNANEKTITTGAKAERSTRKAGMVGRGVLGSLRVRDLKTGALFDLGSGFSMAEREELWALGDKLIGLIVKYQFFPLGSKDKPRFPTFKGFRSPLDMS